MADRYWVGGAGTWDATDATHWSATSGGSAGASAPTSVDNVIFDTLSNATAYAVTVGTNAAAADITIAGPLVGNVTITSGATAVINCYGSWTNAATGVVFSSITGSVLQFVATTTGKTITTNNVSLGTLIVNFNNASGGWTLGSAFTVTTAGTVLTAGSLNTNNFAFNGAAITGSGTGVRSLTLGSSTITLTGASVWQFTTTTNLTFSGASSTIICSNAAPTFAGGGLTYGTVNFTSTGGGGNQITTITGANTFTNLNQTSPSGGVRNIAFETNLTITGTLTLGAANTYNARVQVRNANFGTTITLTVATIATLSDVDFRDITAAGASGTWSGTRLGNGLGNTNITFVAGKTVYWNFVAGGNWSANAWATSSGGAVATANFPLAQDTAIIENTGLTAGNTITMDQNWWMGTLNVTRTNAWTYATSSSPNIYGDATLTSVTTTTGTANFTFLGQGLTQTFTTNGVSLTGGVTQQAKNGTLVLNGNLTTATTQTTTLTGGALNLAGFTLSTGLFNSSNTNTRTLAFGTGKIVITQINTAAIWNTETATNFTVTGTSRVEISGAGTGGQTRSIFAGFTGGIETNSPNFYITAGADNVSFFGTGRKYGTIDFSNGGTSTFTGNFQSENFTFTIYGNLILTASVAGFTTSSLFTGPITFGSTSGTKSITTAGKTYPAPLSFDGVGGTWLCTDALTTSGALTLTNGTLKLAAGTTSTVGSFVTTGTNMKYLLSSVPTFQAQISDASGTNTVTYLTIQDNYATGGATWNATSATNVDAGNNYGWTFSSVSASSAQITMGLRSFTQFRG